MCTKVKTKYDELEYLTTVYRGPVHNYNNSSHVELIMSKSSQNLFTTPFFIFFTYLVAFMMNPSLLGTSRREETGICQKNHQKICHCYIYIKSNRRISCASRRDPSKFECQGYVHFVGGWKKETFKKLYLNFLVQITPIP